MDKVFIVGFWNSGTSILAKLLDTHPEISCIHSKENDHYEMENGGFVHEAILKMGHTNLINYSYEEIVNRGIRSLEIGPNKKLGKFIKHVNKHWGNKKRFVKYNRLIVCKPLLDASFPNSKKILILRDGRSYSICKTKNNQLLKAYIWKLFMEYIFAKWFDDPNVLITTYNRICYKTLEELDKICIFLGLNERKILPFLDKFVGDRSSQRWKDFYDKQPVLAQQIENLLTPTLDKIDEKLGI
jgi:hypothetical protein